MDKWNIKTFYFLFFLDMYILVYVNMKCKKIKYVHMNTLISYK